MAGEIPSNFEPSLAGHTALGVLNGLVYGFIRRHTNDQPGFDSDFAVDAITSAYVLGKNNPDMKIRAAKLFKRIMQSPYSERMNATIVLQSLLADEVFQYVSTTPVQIGEHEE